MANAEIQVGEYVRTLDGNIGKIEQINKEPTDDNVIYIVADEWVGMYEEIANHDFNIIKLIEVGDYVNGIEVEVIGYDNNENGELVETLGVAYVDDDVAWRTELKDISHIYTIVTKEQMEAIQYVV